MTSVACAPWRLAWAERENERRQRAYRDATDAWLRRDDHLARLRIEAAGFLGCTQPRTGLPVDLDHDELVFRVLPVATLVEAEARHVPGLPSPGPCDFADTVRAALPAGLRVLDTGMAVVTSHRVAFAGREHRREWRYADLVGPAHHPDVPITLLPDHGRGSAETARPRLSGLLVPATAVVNFRFYLTLAAVADRSAVTARIDALLAAHRHARPAPPVVAAPDDAPRTAVRLDRRALGAAAVAAVVFATLGPGAVGPQQAGPLRRAEAATIATVEPTVRNAAVTASLRAPSVLVAPPNPRTAAGPAEPARPPAAGPPRPAAPVPSAAVAAAPIPTTAAVPFTEPVPTTAPIPFTEPAASGAPAPSASATPTPTPTPTDPPTAARPGLPSPTTTPDPALVTACLDPLLPLVDRLLCSPTGP
ncbi:hypothetical protein ACLQ29_00875 [Micromonospora sp. DT228]|uniref:hypothetical protein n=1 Tax=Micromonospora sp. DT228 TaxID=3393443 RepID=UPI003CF57758